MRNKKQWQRVTKRRRLNHAARQLRDYTLDKADVVLTAAYGLFTAGYWADVLKDKLGALDALALTSWTVALVASWVIIGIIKTRR